MNRSDKSLVPRRVSRGVVAVGIGGTVLLALAAFSLSFTALMHLADRSGVNPVQAWEWPLIVDGVIVVATVSVVALSGRKGTGYAWLLLVCAALVSVGGNVAQAARLSTEEPTWIAASVATIPPLVLLAATHMTVILTRPDDNPPLATANQPVEMHGMVAVPVGSEMTVTPAMDGLGLSDDVKISVDRAPDRLDQGVDAVIPIASSSPQPVLPEADDQFGDELRTLKVGKAVSMRAAGWSTKDIATELGVTPGSVRRYLKPALSDDQQIGDMS